VLTPQNGKALARKWSGTPQATVFLRDLLKFRERLRTTVIRQEAGLPVSDAFIAELNSLLKRHPSVIALQRNRNKLGLAAAFKPRKPNDLWVPIANAVADLLSDALLERVRKCEGCIVHFLDTSKKGSRRWCSMNICGNKIKVAAYQRRMRAGRKKIRRRANGS
jgi:predicted RNA-binding Zn ribbon-like protein